MDVTAEQVRDAAIAAGVIRVPVGQCSLCGYMMAYIVEGGKLYFDPGCYCTSGPPRGMEPRPWQAAADWINMQSREDVRQRIRQAFGLAPTE